MGYTITIRPRSPKLAKEMLDFCKEHVRPLPEVIEDPNMWDVRGPLPATELSYCQRPTHIGFDYGAHFIEREWCYRLTQWMAVKVGVRRKGLPCYLYDGEDWFSLDPEKFDELGQVRPKYNPKFLLWFSMVPKKIDRRFAKEIRRLDKLWEASRNKLKK